MTSPYDTYTYDSFKRFLRIVEHGPNPVFDLMQSEFKCEHPNNDTVYHYTSIEGAIGIFNSESLWVSRVDSLNDQNEILYGKDLLQTTIEEIKKRGEKENLILSLTNSWESNKIPEIYTISFCKRNNVCEVWDRYGAKGNGVAIGFSSSHLERATTGKYYYKGVDYGNGRFEQLIHRLADVAFKELHEMWSQCSRLHFDASIEWFGLSFFSNIAPFLAFTKEDSWKNEEEMRLLLTNMDGLHQKHRMKHGRKVPYYDFTIHNKINPKYGNYLPIKEVVLGSKVSQEMQSLIGRALFQNGYSDVSMVQSDVQF